MTSSPATPTPAPAQDYEHEASNQQRRKAKRAPSITRRLLSLILLMLCVAATVSAVLLSRNVRKEMREIIDANLIQYANSLYMLEQQVHGYGLVSEPIRTRGHDEDDENDEHNNKPHKRSERSDSERGNTQPHSTNVPSTERQRINDINPSVVSSTYNEYSMAFQVWDLSQNRLMIRSSNAPESAMIALTDLHAGFYDQTTPNPTAQNPNEPNQWRIYVYIDQFNQRGIVVAQHQVVSSHIISEIVTRLTWPIVASFLILFVLIYWSVQRSMRPLFWLNQAIGQRSPLHLKPIRMDNAPAEISPMIQSLNTFMNSLEDSLNKERDFTGNAAHELRTPLAVIDTLTQAAMKTQDIKLLPKIKSATDHARRQIEQLLTLARLDANASLSSTESLNLYDISQNVCADLLNISTKHIDIQLSGAHDAYIEGNSEITYILLKNIIQNACKYTPEASTGYTPSVRIQVQAHPRPSIQITDNGTGLSAEQLTRVTERFYRAQKGHDGFGLGLSIVQRICTLYGAQLHIENRADREPGQTGLSVRIDF